MSDLDCWKQDCRGVWRGHCTSCRCDSYDGGREGKKCEGCGHAPGKHRSLSVQPGCHIILNTPSSPPTVQQPFGEDLGLIDEAGLLEETVLPPEQRCIYNGCTKKRYAEPDGRKVHEFCGRTHAQYYAEQATLNPDEVCKTSGCRNPKRKKDDGEEYFDYCSKYCRDNQQRGQAMVAPALLEECALPDCHTHKYQDPSNGRIHDFCCRSHAAQAHASKSDAISITLASAPEVALVTKKFKESWSHKKGECPTVDRVFLVSNTKLKNRWNIYKDTLSYCDREEYFHGTQLVCNIIGTNTLCSDVDCGVCGIANIGFDRRCIRKNIDFQRFGHGFYLAPNSSKCHDYTHGRCGYRAMLLFDVCPGNKYQLQTDDEKLTAPPEGYNSVHGKHGISLNYDELVLYNPDGALPKYIIVYSKDGDHKIAA